LAFLLDSRIYCGCLSYAYFNRWKQCRCGRITQWRTI